MLSNAVLLVRSCPLDRLTWVARGEGRCDHTGALSVLLFVVSLVPIRVPGTYQVLSKYLLNR